MQGASYFGTASGSWTAPSGLNEHGPADATSANLAIADELVGAGASGLYTSSFTAGAATVSQLTALAVAMRPESDVTNVWSKPVASSDSAVTISYSGNFPKTSIALVYRGADAFGTIDVTATGSAGSGKTVSTSATTLYPGDELVLFQGAAYGGAGAASWSGPSSMSEDGAADAATVNIGVAGSTQPAAGATQTLPSTLTAPGFGHAELTTVLVALRIPPSVLYYHHDRLGSVRLLTDATGRPVAAYSYDAYGNVLTSTTSDSLTNPFQFIDEYRDAESGLIYLRARYYDPGTGQFLTRDPLLSVTHAPYGYADDNPPNIADPSGLIGQDLLSGDQVSQLDAACASWQNPALCQIAAFCHSGEDCHHAGQLAVDIFNDAIRIARSCPGEAQLQSALEAMRETRIAFRVANEGINFYNNNGPVTSALLGVITDAASCAVGGSEGAAIGAAGLPIPFIGELTTAGGAIIGCGVGVGVAVGSGSRLQR